MGTRSATKPCEHVLDLGRIDPAPVDRLQQHAFAYAAGADPIAASIICPVADGLLASTFWILPTSQPLLQTALQSQCVCVTRHLERAQLALLQSITSPPVTSMLSPVMKSA